MRALLMLACVIIALPTGCASYTAPGRAADMSIFTPPTTRRDGRIVTGPAPEARLPTNLGVARVQAPGYRSHTTTSWGHGGYSLVTTRDVETEADLDRLASMTQVADVAPINRLLVPYDLHSGDELRQAAAALHADLLLVYTIDTVFDTEDGAAPLTVISLGLFPTQMARVTSTASALMVDTRSGAVLAVAEGTAKTHQLANAWTSRAAVDQSRRRAERRALDDLLDALELSWGRAAASLARTRAGDGAWERVEPVRGRRYRTDQGG